MKHAQVVICFIFALQSYAAHLFLEPYTEIEIKDENELIANDIQVESIQQDNQHKSLHFIKSKDVQIFPNNEKLHFFKRTRGGGRARRRADARAAKAEAKANNPPPKQQAAAKANTPAPQQHSPASEPAKKGGMGKTKAALLVAGGAAAGATAVHAMGGGGGDPNAPPA